MQKTAWNLHSSTLFLLRISQKNIRISNNFKEKEAENHNDAVDNINGHFRWVLYN